jgi:glyoxylate reductase
MTIENRVRVGFSINKPYIFITRKLPLTAIQELDNQFFVKMWEYEDRPVPREILMEEAKKAHGLLTMLSDRIDAELIQVSANLKVIANLAVGYNNIDVDAATERGIWVCNTPDVLTDTTADLTFALLLSAARRIVESAETVKNGEWKSWSPLLLAGQDVHHKKIGIVGMGKIGAAVAKRATGFDMEILYHNRTRNQEAEAILGARYCDFDELVSKSDFIVCLAPLTDATLKLFDCESFNKMKNTAIFINASRGAVVDEQALFDALNSGQIAGAGLDVFENEPIGVEHPLLTLKNVVALPHIGSSSRETRMAMMKLCVDNIQLVMNNELPKTYISKQAI